jgi:hypothetical protein
MAVARWVYVAQQIASQIVAEWDILDKFLRVISNIDVRIAWIGWLLSLSPIPLRRSGTVEKFGNRKTNFR